MTERKRAYPFYFFLSEFLGLIRICGKQSAEDLVWTNLQQKKS